MKRKRLTLACVLCSIIAGFLGGALVPQLIYPDPGGLGSRELFHLMEQRYAIAVPCGVGIALLTVVLWILLRKLCPESQAESSVPASTQPKQRYRDANERAEDLAGNIVRAVFWGGLVWFYCEMKGYGWLGTTLAVAFAVCFSVTRVLINQQIRDRITHPETVNRARRIKDVLEDESHLEDPPVGVAEASQPAEHDDDPWKYVGEECGRPGPVTTETSLEK